MTRESEDDVCDVQAVYETSHGWLVDLVSTCSVCQRPVTLGIPHSACPRAYIGKAKSSYYSTDQKKTIEYEYDRWERNPASCGKDTECPAAINSITNTVFSAMKTGFAVRV